MDSVLLVKNVCTHIRRKGRSNAPIIIVVFVNSVRLLLLKYAGS